MSLRTRLRKTFSYPSSNASDDSDSDRELDEEHQEHLITRLAAEDARKNSLYRHFFVAIPLIAALFFLYTLLILADSARERGTAVIAVSSLLCTAYILRFQPLQKEEEGRRRRTGDARSPLEKFLLPLNGTLVGLMQVAAVLSWRKGVVDEAWRASLPGIVFALSMFARQQLAPLNLEELKRARYDLKGA